MSPTKLGSIDNEVDGEWDGDRSSLHRLPSRCGWGLQKAVWGSVGKDQSRTHAGLASQEEGPWNAKPPWL